MPGWGAPTSRSGGPAGPGASTRPCPWRGSASSAGPFGSAAPSCSSAITNLGIIGAERVALPRAAADRYGHLGGYGATVMAIALGAIVAAWTASRSRPPREPGRTTYTAALVVGVATVGFGVAAGSR